MVLVNKFGVVFFYGSISLVCFDFADKLVS